MLSVSSIEHTIWFLLPAMLANVTASVSRFVPLLNTPIDFGATWRGIPIFGAHKTWRGLLFGTMVGTVVFFIQKQINAFTESSVLFDYQSASIMIGIALSFGAVLGDLVKSFFKRRVKIPPGRSWFPFDQIDWVVGSVFIVSLFISVTLEMIVISLCFGLLIHLVTKPIGFIIGIDDVKL